MSGQDLILEVQEKIANLNQALKQLRRQGSAYSEAEHNYRVALAKKILEEREKGTPVTIIADICRGTPNVAQLKLQRDISEVTYNAAKEACNVYKLQIKILDNQIEREFRG